MQKLSIKWKLAIIYLIVMIPLIATLISSYHRWYKVRVDRVLLQRIEMANLVGASFVAQIKEIRHSMKFAGWQIKNNCCPQSKAVATLSELQSTYPADFVLCTDETGTVTISTDSRFIGTNLSDNPAFTEIINGNKHTGIAPIEHVNGVPGFYITQAINDSEQRTRIVAMFIGISKLNLELPIGVNVQTAHIIDSNGRLAYESEHPNLIKTNPHWGKYGFVKKALEGKTVTSKGWIFPGSNKKHFVAEVPIKDINWAAGACIHSDIALAPIKKTAKELIIPVIAIFLLSLSISIYIARMIVVSLIVLVKKSKAISVSEGDFKEPVALKAEDEIGAVSHSLDDTKRNLEKKVEELKKSRDELEHRVEERTAELVNVAGRMRLLLESTSEGIYGTDMEGKCVFFNRSATNLTGYKSEEMLGELVHNMIHSKHSDGSPYLMEDCIIEQVVKTGNSIRNSTEVFWKKDGTSFPVEYSASPIIENSSIKGVVITFVDITERKRVEDLGHAVHEINDAISSTLSIDEIMKTVVSKTVKAFNAESGAILMREDERWVIKYGFGAFEEYVGNELVGEGIKYLVDAVRNGDILVIDEITKKRKGIDEICRIEILHNIKACVGVPLLVKDNLLGILVIVYRETPALFTRSQLDFINKLTVSISLALENARLYETERDIADTLQESLLVLPERIEGVNFGSLYRSATVAAKVGGDFFDLFEMEHNRIGMVIGDVSGKGIEASTLTSIIKNTLKAYAYEESSPAAVVKKTNDIIWKSSPPGLFITLFFGILDVDSGDLIYCNAGHPAPLIRHEISEIEMLEANSPVVGVFPKLVFLDENTSILENEILLLYTDGVIEARCEDGFFGEDLLIKIVERFGQFGFETVKSLPDSIFDEVISCTGGNLSDDIAILAISRQPS